MSNILVYALYNDGAFNKNSLGAISEASRIAGELGGEAHAVVVGQGIADDAAAGLGEYGAAKVFNVDAADGVAAPAIDAFGTLFEQGGYKYAIFGGGLLGFEIGAGVAARVDAGLTLEVTAVAADGGNLVAERPILGDSSISTSRYKDKGVIVARLNAFEPKGGGSAAAVEALSVDFSPAASQVTLVTRGEQRGADIDIEGANILITGGRGLGAAEGFKLCEDLAAAYGGNAAVAATRAVVDAGWFPYAGQVGQTRKTVAPKLYVAAGVSGAIQHKVGMQSSENIVAINKDSNAPIFEFCDLGVVGDLNAIMPKLTEAVKARKG